MLIIDGQFNTIITDTEFIGSSTSTEPAATKGKMDETVNQQLFKLIGNSIPIPISLSLSQISLEGP
ncbi:hypothetical protein PGTUg99_022541 [Puccinia graminis f. sp. tritici]|uniref:Uncharacterized protein n=1 Tax=Puccinia graminis f. sp. tritici TaxID=56615 RepID=A0A5B0MRM8_PUCGR|nr:hypothetical protein PGTUg99_022541 [Puccinia graminis f. sp. tritici]